MPIKVYLAGPIFTLAERDFNNKLAEAMNREFKGISVFLPQEKCLHVQGDNLFEQIFDICIDGIDDADCVVAIMDGADADSGTCFEVGYSFGKKIPVLVVRTDIRQLEEKGVNLMIAESATKFIWADSRYESVEKLAKGIVSQVRELVGR